MYGCEYCHRLIGHYPQCPNYMPPQASHYCSICNEGIYDNEEYIENNDGKYAHWECFSGTRDLAEWLGIEVKTMEDNYD